MLTKISHDLKPKVCSLSTLNRLVVNIAYIPEYLRGTNIYMVHNRSDSLAPTRFHVVQEPKLSS